MRRLVDWLVVLAVLCFVWGGTRCFMSLQLPGLTFSPETYWRGTTALLLFAITLMHRERRQVHG